MCPKRRGSGSAAACTASTTSCCTGRWPPANGWIPGRRSRRCGRLGRAPRSSCTSNRSIPMDGSPSSSGGRWCCSVWTGCPISDRCPPITTSPTLRGTTRSDRSPPALMSGWHTATPRCRAIGRHITSTSRWRGRPVSISCSPTACARWRSALTASSACSASTTPAGFRGLRFASHRLPRWAAT